MADEDFIDSEEKEVDVYGDSAREDLAENDEITSEEQAFMDGYEGDQDFDEETDNEKYEKAFEDGGSEEPAAAEEDDGFDDDEF